MSLYINGQIHIYALYWSWILDQQTNLKEVSWRALRATFEIPIPSNAPKIEVRLHGGARNVAIGNTPDRHAACSFLKPTLNCVHPRPRAIRIYRVYF
nr:hypothetical protein SHINE37_42413 [Rhizobiaceae bacterium]